MRVQADLDVLQRVLRESGVDQTVPGPTWSGYLQALSEALVAWLQRVLPEVKLLRNLPEVFGRMFAAAAAVCVVVALVAVLRAALRAQRRRASGPEPIASTPAAAPAPDRDRRQWREEIERRLGAGDMAGALEALWWWFARALSTARADPAWTSRELLAHANRLELAPLALALDRLLYGAQRPRAENVRSFVGRVEDALP